MTESRGKVERLYRNAMRWSEEVDKLLEEPSLGRDVDYALSQLRITFQDIIFLDFEYAVDNEVDLKMWNKHHRVIERYRKHIQKLRENGGKKRPVELRKMVTNFVNFIKATTKFYRGFIQRLASHFGVTELAWVVEQFKLTISSPDEPMECSPETKQLIIRASHRCLVNLGDLSRYREIANSGEKNWAPATGYYDLAKRLVPESGAPHNQLAVISMSDGSNLSATYHLYRAVSVKEPFPAAGANLKIGFQKVLKAHTAGTLGTNLVRREEQMVSDLLSLFVRLHALCYNGMDSSEAHESLQAEMLAQLTQDLKERLLSEGMLNKLVLINIAAEAYAASRTPRRENLQSATNYLRLNVETFNTLLLIFQPELERASTNREKPGGSTVGNVTNSAECISAVGRRMLPALRLYSKWLLVSHQKLQNTLDDTALAVQTKQLWQTYANTLSLLAATFEVESLPRAEYMLEEDVDVIGFLPLTGALKKNEDQQEPMIKQWNSPYRSHPNEEQLSRVLSLIEDGLTLCANPAVPVAVVDGTIIYQEDDSMNKSAPAGLDSLYRPAATRQFSNIAPELLPVAPQVDKSMSLLVGLGGGSVVGSIAPSESASVMVAMNRMVDSLVGPREGMVSEEDEEELERWEKNNIGGLGKKVEEAVVEETEDSQTKKEDSVEEEEIVFIGRKGRAGNTPKKGEPMKKQKSEGHAITGDWDRSKMNQGGLEGDTGRKILPLPKGPSRKGLRNTGPSVGTLREDMQRSSAKLEVILGRRSEPVLSPIQPSPPPPLPPMNQLADGITTKTPPKGTYTAQDLVNQLHTYSQKMNAANHPKSSVPGTFTTNILGTSNTTSPIDTSPPPCGQGTGRGNLWACSGGEWPSPNQNAYLESDASLFMYGSGSGWSQATAGSGQGGLPEGPRPH